MYLTTVSAIEALTGYDLLSALPAKIQRAVESNTQPPIGAINGPFSSFEGAPIWITAAASVDPNGTIVSYSWAFGDGTSGTGVTTAHTYKQDGDYTIRLVTVDNDGLVDTVFTTAHVANVAPKILSFAGDTLLTGETYNKAGSFTDPGADPWSATVDYGDGSGTTALTLTGKTFSLSHVYAGVGTFTVTVGVSDDHVTSTSSASVVVWSPAQGLQGAMTLVAALAGQGVLTGGNANSISQKLDAALKQLSEGKSTPAANQLNAAKNELDAMVNSGQSAAQALGPLQSLINRLIASLQR
jgi:hypothetical protein